jgi:hypothetical protein
MSPLSEVAPRRAGPSSDRPAGLGKAPSCRRAPKKFGILTDLVPITSSPKALLPLKKGGREGFLAKPFQNPKALGFPIIFRGKQNETAYHWRSPTVLIASGTPAHCQAVLLAASEGSRELLKYAQPASQPTSPPKKQAKNAAKFNYFIQLTRNTFYQSPIPLEFS